MPLDEMYQTLYQYLDLDGGIKMLENSNIMFTQATTLDDKNDCSFRARYDFSSIHENIKEILSKQISDHENIQRQIGVRSLCKENDNPLMWENYTDEHKGICIGLNVEYLFSEIPEAFPLVVKYVSGDDEDPKDIWEVYSGDKTPRILSDIITTKSIEYEGEKEVRLAVLKEACDVSWECKKCLACMRKGGRVFPIFHTLINECFDSLYLGSRMTKEEKEKTVSMAKVRFPEMNIFEMIIGQKAIRLPRPML